MRFFFFLDSLSLNFCWCSFIHSWTDIFLIVCQCKHHHLKKKRKLLKKICSVTKKEWKKPTLTENRSLKRFKWVTFFSFKLFKVHSFACTKEFEEFGSRMDECLLTKVQTQRIKKKTPPQIQWVGLVRQILGFSAFPSCSQANTKRHCFFLVCKRQRYWNGAAFTFSKVSTK